MTDCFQFRYKFAFEFNLRRYTKAITAGDCDTLSKSGIRSALGALALPTSVGASEFCR
jgi:hypothetical protein